MSQIIVQQFFCFLLHNKASLKLILYCFENIYLWAIFNKASGKDIWRKVIFVYLLGNP